MARKLSLLSPFERTLYLKSLPILRELPSEDLAVIAQNVRERFFKRGDNILEEGQPLDRVELIVEGSIRASGAEHGGDVLGPEEGLGFLSLLSGRSDVMAVAEQDTTTLEVDGDHLYEVFEDHFTILHNQISGIARNILLERRAIPDGTVLAPAANLKTPRGGPTDLMDRLTYILKGGVFKRTNMDGLIQLASTLEDHHFDAGAKLWTIGQSSGFLYVILRGEVNCRLQDGTHFKAGPGYPLGNLESLCDEPRWYEAVATTPVSCIKGITDTFIDVLEDHFNMAVEFLGAMARNLIELRAASRAANHKRLAS